MEAIISEKTITAPFAGRLGLRRVEKGQYVTAGQALVWLQSLDPIWVDFPVPRMTWESSRKPADRDHGRCFPWQVFKGEVEAFDRGSTETRAR